MNESPTDTPQAELVLEATQGELVTSLTSASKNRSPAYANFDINTDKLLHLLTYSRRASRHFIEEMKNSITPKVESLLSELKNSESSPLDNSDEVDIRDTTGTKSESIVNSLSDVLTDPIEEFTEGFLTLIQWVPVILVTIVEAYLMDVRIYEAQMNPKAMEFSEQSVTYSEVTQAQSIEELTAEMQARWARNFVDDGGPKRWIDRLTKMGARGYGPQTAEKMETLWGVRHVVVHSAGIATRDFIRRHPGSKAKLGTAIPISLPQIREWIRAIYDFVDVTDSYFVQRYNTDAGSND